MVKEAVVFPGQGAQRPGMASDFAEQFSEARGVFERAAAALSFDVLALCCDDEERLNLTEYTQPCLLTAEIAMFAVLEAHFGFAPHYFAGHSLGEYTALVAAGAVPLEVALRLVSLRGRLMQKAVSPGVGSMAALIMEQLPGDEICSLAHAEGVDIANDNSPTQVVISGEKSSVERVCTKLTPYVETGMRIVPLTVSAPFHSRHMAGVEAEFRQALEAVRDEFKPDKAINVTSNFTGKFYSGSSAELLENLTRQISGTVRWRDNMATLVGVSENIYEVGPNRPLRGFFKAMGISVKAIIDVRSAQKTWGAAQGVA